nr:DUF917 domain-containing protein [Desulfosporosinus metallidurans]
MLRIIEGTNIEALALGSIFLGSGGGGNALLLRPFLEERLLKHKLKVPIISFHQLPDDFLVAAVGFLGSPELLEENPPDGDEGLRALHRLEQALGRKVDALFSLEGGGVNNVYPLLVSLKTGLPLLDADGMGRSFPKLQMTTCHIFGQMGTPFALVNYEGNDELFTDEDNFKLELNTRKALMKYGGVGFFSGFAMNGRAAKESLISGTLSFALRLGEVLQKGSYEEMKEELLQVTRNSLYGEAIELFIGCVEELGQFEGLKLRSISLKGSKAYEAQQFNVLLQYENVFAYRNNKLVAMVPDLIIFLEYATGRPLNNNEIQPDMEIAVIGVPCPTILRTRRALSVVGPQSFEYNMEYQSLEQLHASYYFGEGS